jgi:dTDP-4-dehydrorhamnose 3,5-epimerase
MNVIETALPGVLIIEPDVYRDQRGFLVETFQDRRYREVADISLPFVQDNLSSSRRGVLRGLHAQKRHPQGKLVRVARGEVFDVAVDIHPQSATFGCWAGVVLSEGNFRQMWIPPGYAHGFLVLSEVADLEYKCTDYYHPEDEVGVVWNDPGVAIDWPLPDPIVSSRDAELPTLAQLTGLGE